MSDDQYQEFLRALRKGIMQCFDISDLKVLCADLGIDYDNLGGEDKQTKVVDLISYMKNRGEITRLWQYCTSERQDACQWLPLPDDNQLQKSPINNASEIVANSEETTSTSPRQATEVKTRFRFGLWSILAIGAVTLGLLFLSTLFDYPLPIKSRLIRSNGNNISSTKIIDRVRVALVISNYKLENFKAPVLTGPQNDIGLVTRSLESVGFRVKSLVNAKKQDILDAWKEIETVATYGGIALLYFAGNGYMKGGDDLIIPVDYKNEADAINISGLMRMIKPLGDSIEGPVGDVIMYSTRRGEYALDTSPGKKESPFAIAFSTRLKEQHGDLTEVFDSIVLETKRLTEGKQTPCYTKSFPGKFSFADRSKDNNFAILKIMVIDTCRGIQ